MNLSLIDSLAMGAALVGPMMAGSGHLRTNLSLYGVQTALLAVASGLVADSKHEPTMYVVALAIVVLKAIAIPFFLNWIAGRIAVRTDSTFWLRPPVAMHLCVLFLGFSYVLSQQLPVDAARHYSQIGATAAISLVLSGLVLMLTRRLAISQIVGFLVTENGIYLFALTQTNGMPLFVEMGILLDVLAGVMIAGLLLFDIKKSFEHIDVEKLADLKD